MLQYVTNTLEKMERGELKVRVRALEAEQRLERLELQVSLSRPLALSPSPSLAPLLPLGRWPLPVWSLDVLAALGLFVHVRWGDTPADVKGG